MLRPWHTQFSIAHSSGATVHEKLVNKLIEDITNGRLQKNTLLPGSRTLALVLGINRKTVQLAYEELIAQGWLSTEARRGTFVSAFLPEQQLSAQYKQVLSRTEGSQQAEKQRYIQPYIAVNDGIPDERFIPYEKLSRAFRRALISASRRQYLGYGDPRGTPELRQALHNMLSNERFLNIAVNNICTVRGSQMGLYLAARVLASDHATAVFDTLTYPPALACFASAGFNIVRCKIDADGLDIEHLQQLLHQHKVTVVYTTPHHHYPTTVTMPLNRRLKLLQLSREYGFYIVEDDYDHEFHFDTRPVPPLASLPESEQVVHIGSLSKVFAPGLRVGYMVAQPVFIDKAVEEILLIDRQGNTLTELALAEMLEAGEVKKHIRKCRKLYKSRRDHCVSELKNLLPAHIRFQIPAGGLALWINCGSTTNIKRALPAQAGYFSYTDEQDNLFLRFGYATLSEKEITKALLQLATIWLPG